MRILVLSRSFPWPLTNGGNLRTRALLEALARRHEVVFSAPLAPALRPATEAGSNGVVSRFLWVDPAGAECLRLPSNGGRAGRFAAYVKDCLTTGAPYFYRRRSAEWQGAVERELPGADAVLCRGSPLATLVPRDRLGRVIVDEDDLPFLVKWREARLGTHGLGSLLHGIEAGRTFVMVQRTARRAARTLVASEGDARRLLTRRTTVIRNGIFLDAGGAPEPRRPDGIVFVGSCGYDPNRLGLDWFLRRVWPRVFARHPAARFAIVGSHATLEEIPAAASPGVTLHDRVPSVRPWFESAAVSVVPIFVAGGTRIKILESLAYGTPVVSTPLGAEGLTGYFGRDEGLLLARDEAAMADQLVRILAGDGAAAGAALRGGAIVRDRFTWEGTTRDLAERLEGWVGSG